MQIFQLFKNCAYLIIYIAISPYLYSDYKSSSLEFSQLSMDADWDFLPEVPSAFKSSRVEAYTLNTEFNKIGISLAHSDLSLNLQRSSEPIDVSLDANKQIVTFFYKINEDLKINLIYENQSADQQQFSCYSFSGITLGSCDSSDIQIGTNNPKYDVLGENFIAIDADTSTKGVRLDYKTDSFLIDDISIGFLSTEQTYNWLSPLEDIESPFIRGLVINGVVLGDALDQSIAQLPQRTPWTTNQINFNIKKSIPLTNNIEIYSEIDFIFLKLKEYKAYNQAPDHNIGLNIGTRVKVGKIKFELFADIYKNNLIGFEHITFNQRTEHYFDKTYGNVGAKLIFNF
tara:strand:- start:74 stop:1102 length:1029 start_codon:yes stop_codon:yes gene_type:complete